MRKFVICAVVLAILLSISMFFVPIGTANAGTEEYKIFIQKERLRAEPDAIVVPVKLFLNKPEPNGWEITAMITGDNYFRTKTMTVLYSGSYGMVFSNDEKNELGAKVPQIVSGQEYYIDFTFKRKYNLQYENLVKIPMKLTAPFPKLKCKKGEIRDQGKKNFKLSVEIQNMMARGRVDYWFEVVSAYDACQTIICGQRSYDQNTSTQNIDPEKYLAETEYKIPEKDAKYPHMYRIAGWDYSRNEFFSSDWYDFNNKCQK